MLFRAPSPFHLHCLLTNQIRARTISYSYLSGKAKTNMADGVTQLCELCNRLRMSLFWSQKSRNMPPIAHLILASLTGVAIALIATYIPSIWRPLFGRPSLESYAPGFNLVLAPQTALVENLSKWKYNTTIVNVLLLGCGKVLVSS